MPQSKTERLKGAAVDLAETPGAKYILLGGLAYLILRFALPDLFEAAKRGFSAVMDNVRGAISSILGAPSSQDVNSRSLSDSFTGLFAENDRALSDFQALAFGETAGGSLSSFALDKRIKLISQGWLNPDGTAKTRPQLIAAGLLNPDGSRKI